MAKGARASSVKRNNANLRAKIFGPAVDERTARLSAKLQELVARPGPNEGKHMELDEPSATKEPKVGCTAQLEKDMDIEMKGADADNKPSAKRKSSRVEKKVVKKKKAKHQVVFPTSAAKRKRISQSKKKAA